MRPAALLAALALALALVAPAHAWQEPLPDPTYPGTVGRVAGMVSDSGAQALASRHGLQLQNVLWEDTGRWQGSSVGPNISDVTIEVISEDRDARPLALMPVLRFPNFSDRTADIRLDRVYLRVGNERKDGREEVLSLRDFLENPGRWLSSPGDGRIRSGSLLAPRDTHALVSAQAAFLPIPRGGKAITLIRPLLDFDRSSSAGSTWQKLSSPTYIRNAVIAIVIVHRCLPSCKPHSQASPLVIAFIEGILQRDATPEV